MFRFGLLWLGISIAALVSFLAPPALGQQDPLSSWNDTAPKKAILEFVGRVTSEEGADYVLPEQRIAVFDNDGTLWAEQPIYFQFQFGIDRVAAMAPEHPDWEQKQPFKGILDGDMKAVAASGEHGILELMMATHTGITTEKFADIVDLAQGCRASALQPPLHRTRLPADARAPRLPPR
jgi:hypothetical protein